MILEDGFKNNTVQIKINEKEVFHKKDVSTQLLIGMADSIRLNVPGGHVTFKISLPDRNIVKSFSADISNSSVLKFSLEDTELIYKLTDEQPEDLGYI
jgi:hypothetical protein